MKTVGIIGGLGPETTAKFYMNVVFAFSKKARQRPNILISNVAIPLVIEKEIITESRNEDRILPYLISSAKQLENGGVDFIVIPCNTVHIFIELIRKAVNIPVLSIVEETADFLERKRVNEIAILGTMTTIKNELFNKKLEVNGIKIKIPHSKNQSKISCIIHNLVTDNNTQKDKEEFLKIIKAFKTPNILLACTDLQLLNPKIENVNFFDTMEILANATVREMLC